MSSVWQYYNHAIIPLNAPHNSIDMDAINTNPLWMDRKTLFARWTSDFDCGYETAWWFCIKDEPFDIMGVNAKRRYEINKGNKNFFVKRINPLDYSKDLFEIFSTVINDYSTYSGEKDEKSFVEDLKENEKNNIITFGAFDRDDESLCGYAYIRKTDYITYLTHKVIPKYEKRAVNAAMVYNILKYYEEELRDGMYICDGERNIYHETKFQEYLEKYFGFRKAYCKLQMRYKPLVGIIVAFLYPIRRVIGKISGFKKINAVLKMHEYYIMCKKDKNDK